MNHFLLYAARLQDKGVTRLSVELSVEPGTEKDRTRIMIVKPSIAHNVPSVFQAYPARTFDLDGTDRVLENLQDDLVFSNNGQPTKEQVEEVIVQYPIYKDDLRDWYEYYSKLKAVDLEDLEAEGDDTQVDPVAEERSAAHIRGLLRGLDISRRRDAKTTSSPSGDQPE